MPKPSKYCPSYKSPKEKKKKIYKFKGKILTGGSQMHVSGEPRLGECVFSVFFFKRGWARF